MSNEEYPTQPLRFREKWKGAQFVILRFTFHVFTFYEERQVAR